MVHIELGAIADFSFTDGNNILKPVNASGFQRICFGAGVGGGLQVALGGGYITGNGGGEINPTLPRCAAIEIDAAVNPGVGVGAQVGLLFNGRFYFEYFYGVGLRLELGGASFCVGWGV